MSFDDQRTALEGALNAGAVRWIGECGVRSASPVFLTQLDDLPPSARRLALAKACALPWKDRIDELPECYRYELSRALDDWHDDRAAYPDMGTIMTGIFADVHEPISATVLRQVVELTPTSRYSSLIFALAGSWPGGPMPLLEGSPEAPRWLARELAYTGWTSKDEFRAWRETGWVR